MARNRIHNYLEKRREQVSQQLWNEFVGNVLAMELDHVLLSEPLDDPQFDDMDEEQRMRIREAGF